MTIGARGFGHNSSAVIYARNKHLVTEVFSRSLSKRYDTVVRLLPEQRIHTQNRKGTQQVAKLDPTSGRKLQNCPLRRTPSAMRQRSARLGP